MTAGGRGLLGGAGGGFLAVVLMYLGIFTAGVPAILLAVWDLMLRIIPMDVFGFLIVRLKFAARPLAFWGMLAGMVGLAALAGFLLARWRPTDPLPRKVGYAFALAVLALLPVFPAALELLQSRLEAVGDASRFGFLSPSVRLALAVVAYAVLFALTWGVAARAGSGARRMDSLPGAPLTRREVLHRSVVLAGAVLLGSTVLGVLSSAAHAAAAAAKSLFERIKGLPPEITPNDKFYVISKNPPGFDPSVDASKWKLEVGGLVGKPVSFTLDEIKRLPVVTQHQTLECISNEVGGDLISNAVWRGVRLREVLSRAGGVGAKTFKIAFRCADGYTESLPLADAMHPDTLLAFEMNGEPLPRAHGFPLRLLVPGLFGMKNPKWITKIEAVDYDFQGYWERSGWSDEAVVKTMSKFTTIRRGARLKAGEEVGLGGVAYAGDRGIKTVEVSTDDGKTWRPAQVKPALGKYTWVLWASIWTPAGPGEYTVKVRAIDGVGVVQTSRAQDTLPDGASGYHTLRVRVGR